MAGSNDIRAGKAFVEVYVDKTALNRGLKSISTDLKAFGAGVSSMGTKFMALGGGVVAPMLATAKSFATVGSGLNDMAARTGVSTNALSELGFAAEQSGASLADVEIGVKRMQKAITAAKDGPLAGLKGMAPEEQFMAIAESLSAIQDPTARAAKAVEIFGRSGTMLIPMLGDVKALRAEAVRLGLSMGPQQAAAADALGDAWDSAKASFKAVAVAVGSALAPMLTGLTEKVTGGIAAVRKWIGQNEASINTIFKVGVGVLAAGAAIMAYGKILTTVGGLLDVFRATLVLAASNGLALSAGLGVIGIGLAAVAACFVNAKIKGITFGESVLDLTNKLTGLDNAFSRLQDGMAEGKAIGMATAVFEKGIQEKSLLTSQKAIDEMQANRDRLATEADALRNMKTPGFFSSMGAVAKYWGKGEALKAKEAELQRADILLGRYKTMQKEMAAAGILESPLPKLGRAFGALSTAFIKSGMEGGKSFAGGFMAAWKSRLEASREVFRDLQRVLAEGIADPQKREERLANLDYDAKVARARKDNAGPEQIAIIESTRQAALKNIRDGFAQETANKRKEIETATADEIAALQIETTLKGHQKELALLRLRQGKELAAARAVGDDLGELKKKHGLEEQLLGLGETRGSITRGTFSGAAIAGLGVGGGMVKKMADGIQQLVKVNKEEAAHLARISLEAAP